MQNALRGLSEETTRLRFWGITKRKSEECGKMKITKNLILYRDFENEQLFYDFTWVMENYQNEYYNKEDVEGLFYECLKN